MNRLMHTLAVLAAGVWLGGMVLIGPFVAKNTFTIMPEVIRAHSDATSDELIKMQSDAAAGRIMAKNFADFDRVQLVCAAVLVLSLAASAAVARRKFGVVVRLLLALVATITLIYSVQFVTPKILAMQDTVATAADGSALQTAFDEFHETSVAIAKVNLVLLAIVALSLGWAGPPRTINDDKTASPSPPGTA